jgi:hypothetical protein
MSEATELILMAYKLIYKNMTNSLTRTNVVKQSEITMTDGSILIYNLEITLQTEREFSIAYQKIKDITHREMIEPIELSIVHMFSDCPEKEDGEEGDLLTADDYPECAQ